MQYDVGCIGIVLLLKRLRMCIGVGRLIPIVFY